MQCDNDKFFRPVEHDLVEFGRRFRLRLDKYDKGSTNWDFGFRHPKGGVGVLQVVRTDDERLLMAAHWTLDDREAGVRFTRSIPEIWMSRDDPKLVATLEEVLRDMCNWEADNWTRTYAGFKELWAAQTRRDDYYESLSIPKLQ